MKGPVRRLRSPSVPVVDRRRCRAKPWEAPDGLWERIEPMLPKRQRRFRYPGRKPLDDRLVLQGILFVLHTGIGWEHLPQELGFGCGMTAWRRLRAWQQRACGSGCTKCCWQSCKRPTNWSGRERSPTPATCRRKRGRQDWAQPGRSRPGRQQASPPCRGRRPPARVVTHWREPQRCHPARRTARPSAARPRPGRPTATKATDANR